MDSSEIRSRFLKFFEKRNHKIIPSSSLVPEGDPSVLFTTAGMQQFKPYYTAPDNADKDFGSKNTTSTQKCLRTNDIEEVGDETHNTFFEMLGNFSFGGYWKKEAIEYAHEFITKELGLTIDYVSIFKDDGSGIPADLESGEIWQSIDPNLKIKEHKKEDNFWGPTGDEGPCGPTTEIYINGVEIWNIVFNEFYKTREGKYDPLKVKGIDTGMGLERLLVQVQDKNNVFDTDLFTPIMGKIDEFTTSDNQKAKRIVADHIRTATFMIGDGVLPGNTGRGYILRRLLRRAVRYADVLSMKHGSLFWLATAVIEKYKQVYPNLSENSENIKKEIDKEESKFRETLTKGLKEFEKGTDPFILFTTYGFPIEFTVELAKEQGKEINLEDFNNKMGEHQKLSQTSSAGMFKGGLANHDEKTIKLHTAHHLLLAALQEVVDKSIKQRGSNITEERLRMDFSFDRKLTDEEKKKVEDFVNENIKQGLSVVCRQLPLDEAEKIGAEMEFGAKYPETVSVYFIEDENGNPVSKEFCGGPHVKNTAELDFSSRAGARDRGPFKILKEEAVAQGVRRIKATLS